MYVRREGRDDDAVFGIAEDIFNRLPNHAFRGCIAGRTALVLSQSISVTPFLPICASFEKVNRFSVNRCIVDLKVAGVEYHACGVVIARQIASAIECVVRIVSISKYSPSLNLSPR